VRTGETCRRFRKRLATMQDSYSLSLPGHLRGHAEECRECWSCFVAARWAVARDSQDLEELREYLGPRFQEGVDSSWKLADEWSSESRESREAVERFYRETPWYLYNLVLWSATGQRPSYVEMARPVIDSGLVTSVLDFGSGVGNDALQFARMGLKVIACDFECESSRFLRWRAAQRGLEITSLDPAKGECGLGASFDLLWLMDVLEHLPEPFESLNRVAGRCGIVIHSSEHDGTSNGRHPFHFRHSTRSMTEMWTNWGFVKGGQCGSRGELTVWWKKSMDARMRLKSPLQ
jgi:SAM-dependent methyltransferase